jgi:hypothetical protein
MRPAIVYETADGGGVLARVVTTFKNGQVLVQLEPKISRLKLHWYDRDASRSRGYIVFKRESLTWVAG